nr:hypothetical protein [Hymenobacter qilianensis]
MLLALRLLRLSGAAQLVVVDGPAPCIRKYSISGVYGFKMLLVSGATAVLIGMVLNG